VLLQVGHGLTSLTLDDARLLVVRLTRAIEAAERSPTAAMDESDVERWT
jgi:hypothetical protein